MKEPTTPRLKLDDVCNINQSSCLVETMSGYAIIQRDMPASEGAKVLISAFGAMQFAFVRGGVLITEDGESIEGEGMDDVIVIGIVTFVVSETAPDNRPVI